MKIVFHFTARTYDKKRQITHGFNRGKNGATLSDGPSDPRYIIMFANNN